MVAQQKKTRLIKEVTEALFSWALKIPAEINFMASFLIFFTMAYLMKLIEWQ